MSYLQTIESLCIVGEKLSSDKYLPGFTSDYLSLASHPSSSPRPPLSDAQQPLHTFINRDYIVSKGKGGAGAIMSSALVFSGWKLPRVLLTDSDERFLFDAEVSKSYKS